MQFAIEVTTGVETDASDADRWERFICPCCLGAVDLCATDRNAQMRAHFRHHYATYQEACDNYQTAGGEFHTRWERAAGRRPRVVLSASLVRGARRAQWTLELFLSAAATTDFSHVS